MKIAIISDSHDNIANIDKMLEFVKKENINVMLHCGDVCAPGVMRYLAENFSGNIYLIYGNVDGDQKKMTEIALNFPKLRILGEEGKIELDKFKIGLVHYPDRAKKMAESGEYDLVFYGHNHKAWDEKIGNCRLLNPGTLAGLFALATFAVYDTEINKAELKIVHQLP